MSTPLPTLFMGINFLDPQWLLSQFGTEFVWISMLMIFIECGLFFPFLPGDALLFAIGIFIASGVLDIVPGPPIVDVTVALVVLTAAAFAGNVVGYEIGRKIGPPLYARDRGFLKKKYFDETEAFFDKHGKKALVAGRFVAFVRTFITVVAGVTKMERHRFYLWSGVGAIAWTFSVTLLGYFLGKRVPWLRDNIDYAILAIFAVGGVIVAIDLLRRKAAESYEHSDGADRPDESARRADSQHH